MNKTIRYHGFEIYVVSEQMPATTYGANQGFKGTGYQAQVSSLSDPSGKIVYRTEFMSSQEDATADAEGFCDQ